MRLPRSVRRALVGAVWAVGGRLPHPGRRAVCWLGSRLVPLVPGFGPWTPGTEPRSGLQQWDANFSRALGRRPLPAERRHLVSSWFRNNLMSLSLARWSDRDVLARARISDADVAKLRESLSGRGLVLALPHMGSWDFAGAWCARVGIKVVSVAERLPSGLFERFRDARAGMGMDIYPVDEPDLIRKLVADVRAGRMVCLLSDRDLSGRGVAADWPVPGGVAPVSVTPGPGMVARITGCDLRIVSTRFDGDSVVMSVSDAVPPGSLPEMMGEVAAGFAAAVREHPTSWVMLQPFFKD